MKPGRPTLVPERITLPRGPMPDRATMTVEEVVSTGHDMATAVGIAHAYRKELATMDADVAWARHIELAVSVVGDDPLYRDVAAVAACMIELLTGEPLTRDAVPSVAESVRAARPDCPAVLAEAFARALAPTASSRFASADELARVLSVILDPVETQPTASRLPPMTPELLRRLTRASSIRRKASKSEPAAPSPTSYAIDLKKR